MDEVAPKQQAKEGRTTLRDVGRGLILLGFLLLALTGLMLVMALAENEYYGLFSGNLHLAFYLCLATILIVSGIVLARGHRQADEPPHN